MDIVKLDEYEYEISDLFNDDGKYLETLVYLNFEDLLDPSISDVSNELSICKRVHIDGRYFKCIRMSLHRHEPIIGGTVLKLNLIEENWKDEYVI